ncbi:MauE/DoxX family redox-associated membrane protein [Rothia aeria]|uniref:MauE/DoxX family redox-associated membrane protein n=1 Tax=Rothia aeria TaxID=172042 RepID=UPI000A687065|nr:MauE/DoxX family redox-associated membrane protein [Rothia aeria]
MTPLLLCTSILVVTLTASGIAKAKDPSSTVEGILNLGLDSVAPLKLTPAVLPWAELVLAAGLLLAPGPLFPVFAIASCALMVFYLVVIARALATGRTEGCNCFGKKSAAPVSRYTLIRNIALTIAGILTVVASFVGGKAVVYELVGLNGSGWLWAVGAALIALTLWAIQRGESLAEPAPDIPEVVLPSAADESEDYVRVPIPYASIYTTDGRVTTLRDMSRVQARVLFFASPTCGSCTPILKTIPRWQKLLPQLGLHPVFSSEEKIHQAHKLEKLDEGVEALVDPKHAAMHNFGRGTPMAVILGSDGMLAGGPVAGTSDVKQLMDDLLVEFGAIKDPNAPKEAQPAQAAASASAAGASEQRAPVQGGSATQAPARPAAVDNVSHGQVGRTAPAQQKAPASEQPTQPQAAVSKSQNAQQPAPVKRDTQPTQGRGASTQQNVAAQQQATAQQHNAAQRQSASQQQPAAPQQGTAAGVVPAQSSAQPQKTAKNTAAQQPAAASSTASKEAAAQQSKQQKAQDASSPAQKAQTSAPAASAAQASGDLAQATAPVPTQKPNDATEPLTQVEQQKASQPQQGGTGSGQTAQQTQPARVQPAQPANKPQPAGGGAEAAKTTSAAKAYRLGMRQQAVRAKSAGAQSAPAGSPTRAVGSSSGSFNGPRKRYTPGASMLKSRRSPAELSVPQAATRPPLKPSSRAASASMAKLRSQQITQKAAAKK